VNKRAARRHLINTTIVCHHLTAANSGVSFDGIMKNCCIHGMYAELAACFKVGTFLVIRVTGGSWGYSKDEGFLLLAVAEVRWTKLIVDEQEARYAAGLKYVMI